MSKVSKTKIKKYTELFKQGLYRGIGTSFGLTIGFTLLSILLFLLVKISGGLPLIGDWIANLVEATQSSLSTRSIQLPQQ